LLHSKIDSRPAQQTQTPSRRPRRECDTHVLQQAAERHARGLTDASSLQTLLALSLDERREAVARDVRRRAPQFSTISAHDLADALDVPEHWRPGNEWSFTRYAPIVSAEEHARYNSPASELVYLIEDAVSAERFQQLLKHSEPLDDADDPSFAFLTKGRTQPPGGCDRREADGSQRVERNELHRKMLGRERLWGGAGIRRRRRGRRGLHQSAHAV
jgi:hypothetical protein